MILFSEIGFCAFCSCAILSIICFLIKFNKLSFASSLPFLPNKKNEEVNDVLELFVNNKLLTEKVLFKSSKESNDIIPNFLASSNFKRVSCNTNCLDAIIKETTLSTIKII